MGLDRYYRGWGPRLSHLVTPGGLSGEVLDLRKDIEEALKNVAEESDATIAAGSAAADDAAVAVANLQTEIGQVAADANAALVSAVDSVSNDLVDGLEKAESDAASYADVAAELLNERINTVQSNLTSSLVSAVDTLANEVADAATQAQVEAAGYADDVRSTLRQEILQSSADSYSALDAEVTDAKNELRGETAVVSSEAAGYATDAKNEMLDALVQAAADAQNSLDAEITSLAGALRGELDTAKSEATGYANDVKVDLETALAQLAADTQNTLDTEINTVNNRIGAVHEVQTTDGVATLLANITPGVLKSVRIIAKIQGQRANLLERAAYTIEALARAIPATENLLLNSNPLATETVTIGTTVYKFEAAPAAAFDVTIGGSAEATLDNLVAAINLTGTPGVDYHADTTAHPDFTAEKAAGGATPSMDIAAKIPGAAGNGVATTETIADVLSVWGAAVTSGGSDMQVDVITDNDDYEDDAGWDAAIAVDGAGTGVDINVTGAALTVVNWRGEVRVVEQL